jgi:hypothetical protein
MKHLTLVLLGLFLILELTLGTLALFQARINSRAFQSKLNSEIAQITKINEVQ